MNKMVFLVVFQHTNETAHKIHKMENKMQKKMIFKVNINSGDLVLVAKLLTLNLIH